MRTPQCRMMSKVASLSKYFGFASYAICHYSLPLGILCIATDVIQQFFCEFISITVKFKNKFFLFHVINKNTIVIYHDSVFIRMRFAFKNPFFSVSFIFMHLLVVYGFLSSNKEMNPCTVLFPTIFINHFFPPVSPIHHFITSSGVFHVDLT